MTTITIEDTNLVVNVEGLDKLLAFKGSVTIPLEHVVSIAANTEPLMDYRHAAFGLGTIFAGKIQTGTFKQNGEKSFWDVRDPKKAIVIMLKDDTYTKLIIEVADPQTTIELVNSHIK